MVKLIPIGEDNYRECIDLKVDKAQENFVASNVFSLAEAYIYRGQCEPMGIYDGDAMAGFIMYGFNCDEGVGMYEIYRLMIDARWQRRGLGRTALSLAIEDMRRRPDCATIRLSTANPVAEALYASLGFARTGKMQDGEHVMELPK